MPMSSDASSNSRRPRCHPSTLLCVVVSMLLLNPASTFTPSRLTLHPDMYGSETCRTLWDKSSRSRRTLDKLSIPTLSTRTRQSTTSRRACVVALPVIPTSSMYLALLAVQFGIQPLLTKAFTPQGIIRSTVVIAQDFLRFTTCFLVLRLSGKWSTAIHGWTWQASLLAAGIPSLLYMVQNYFALIAYQTLPPVTFNILNQTKTLSAAMCCYLILGRKQSPAQILALFLLLLSALVIEKMIPLPGLEPKVASNEVRIRNDEKAKSKEGTKEPKRAKVAAGVIPILIASFISGLAGAVSQKNLQVAGRDVLVFSMELSVISFVTMIATLILGSPDGKQVRTSGMGKGWTWKTWIPVLTNAAGGVVVGMVTKHSGAVRKGFGLIFGLLLSGVLQNMFLSDEGITAEQVLGGVLASISVWMHSSFPSC